MIQVTWTFFGRDENTFRFLLYYGQFKLEIPLLPLTPYTSKLGIGTDLHMYTSTHKYTHELPCSNEEQNALTCLWLKEFFLMIWEG